MAVATVDGTPPPVNVTVGFVTYPVPGLVITTPITLPEPPTSSVTAMAVAPVPPPPEIVIVGIESSLVGNVVETAFTDRDTTPSVAAGMNFITANGGATSISDFDDGTPGRIIIIRFNDANTTVVNDASGTGAGPIFLSGGANKAFALNQMLVLQMCGGAAPSPWYQIGGEI